MILQRMNRQTLYRTALFKAITLLILVCLSSSCQSDKTKGWSYQEMGRFEAIELTDIPREEAEPMLELINTSRVVRLIQLGPDNDFNSFFTVKSLHASARELFYLSDIQEDVKSIRCHMESKDDMMFPLLILSDNKKRISEVNTTSRQFYTLNLDFKENEIISQLKTIQNITAEQQQQRLYKPIMEQHRKSPRMRLPKTILEKTEVFSRDKHQHYLSGKLTPEYIDHRFFEFKEGKTDTLFMTSPFSEYLLYDDNDRITEKALDKTSSTYFTYGPNRRLEEVSRLIQSSPDEAENQPKVKMKYRYTQDGSIDAILHFNEKEINYMTESYRYQFQRSDKGFTKASVWVQTSWPGRSDQPIERQTEIFFDKKMNWIKIKKNNGEIDRRIDYKK